MNDYFIFGTLSHVCTNEKFDSMYGWYGSNAQNMWKIANFGRFLMIFGPFGARYHPLYYTRNPMIDCFTVGTFHNVYSKEKSDSLYGYYGCNGKNVLKNRSFLVIFGDFWDFWGLMAHISPQGPQNIYFFNPSYYWGKIGSKPYATCHAYSWDPRILDVGQNATTRAFVRRIFAFISRFSIPHFIDIYIFELFTSFRVQRYATTLCFDQ